MNESTQINQAKLSHEGRSILKRVDEMFSFSNVNNVVICSKDFNVLLKAVSLSNRFDCDGIIRHHGKQILRGK